MRTDPRELAAVLTPGAVLVLAGLGLGALVGATLSEAERETLAAMLAPRAGLLLLAGAALATAVGFLGHHLYAACVERPIRLAEAAQAMILHGTTHAPLVPLAAGCGRATRELAALAERLAEERDALRSDMEARVRAAARGIEQERNRLAALMSELTQSVVVCNLEGRILLYNLRAQQLFRELSCDARPLLIGLGRSIYPVFDRELVTHGLERIRAGPQPGASEPAAHLVTRSAAGRMLRAQMTGVRDISAASGPAASLSGFVLLLQDVTLEFEEDAERDRLLQVLVEGALAAVRRLQEALDTLERPVLDPAAKAHFTGVASTEARALATHLGTRAAGLRTHGRWPLEDMRGEDLLNAALSHIRSRTRVHASACPDDGATWLKVDSFTVLKALAALATRLFDEFGVEHVQLRLHDTGERIHLELLWRGSVPSTEAAIGWGCPASSGPAALSGLCVREVVERHGGAFWFEPHRAGQQAMFRFALPRALPRKPQPAPISISHADGDPEFYDFELFCAGPPAPRPGDRLLVDLAYTVFDTETTGLEPARGDEILQIGAVRIVRGKLLRHDCFEQLIDPGRSIPAASASIHGITAAMVSGRPAIETVLAAFHAFTADTMLVAHNAAFDMRFLQAKEGTSGVRFDQPVLDTLLLSAVVSPHQASHALEAIAERLGIPVVGRHSALGDAMLTANVFLALLPLLAARGIHTLGQAREAARRSWYARLRY